MSEVSQAPQRALILVIDDSELNLTMMREILGAYYTVKLASTGARGLEIAATLPPDLILLSVTLPDIDGFEVCRRLKAMPDCANSPVIFLAPDERMDSAEVGLALGAVDYVAKPLNHFLILARVRSQLALKAANEALRVQMMLAAHANTRAQGLLHNIFPVEIANELSSSGQVLPVRHESASVLFTDFSGFTHIAATMPVSYMVAELNEIFAAFDDICDEEGVEKIKTIGDAFMAASGLPGPCANHAQRLVKVGLRMHAYLDERNLTAAFKWPLRVGIHTGPVMSGMVGKRKFAFDIWGDTVNVACRMEMSGAIGKVNISAYTFELVREEFNCAYRGKVNAKGKGMLDMYFVDSIAK